jgi:predicted ATPase
LTGPGGTGKTRLALQAAAEASDSFPDGIFWVPLAPLRDPDLVLSQTAAAVGVREGEGGWALDELTKGLAGKRLLVLYDNVEHLLPEAVGHVGGLVAACPTVTVVATSRERLALPGERVFAVPPMSEVDGEALFRRRATEAGAELGESAELRTLCAHLDNLPLALELAAARMLVFSPAQLLNRLVHRLDLLRGGRGTDSRQETLRATIAWSHDLLEVNEQQLFRRLSVFAGGCSFDSAERVAGAEPDTLQSLLDKSLLRRGDGSDGPRFWMLETIREFAAEQLAAADETADLQRSHLDYYAAIAKASYDETWGGHDDIDLLVAERDNIALALTVALETNPERALELAAAVTPDWIKRGEYREGRQKLAEVLARAPETPTQSRVSALLASCILADQQMDMEAVGALARNALDMSRILSYRLGEGHALARLGVVAWRQGRLDEAERLLEDAVDVLDTPGGEPSQELALAGIASVLADLGDLRKALAIQREVVARVRRKRSDASLAFHLNNLGFLEGLAGQTEQARRSIEESVALARQVGRKRSLSASLHSLGFVLQASAPTDALAAFSESLELAREIDSPAQVASCLEGAATIFVHCGDPAHAASLLGAASMVHTRTGDARSAAEKAEGVATLSLCREALSVEAFANAWEKGTALDANDAAGWALEIWSNRVLPQSIGN